MTQENNKAQKASEETEPANFESLMNDLSGIVQKLESGELSLEDSLDSFERGMELAKQGNQILDAAEQKVELLLKKQDGSVVETPFETDESTPLMAPKSLEERIDVLVVESGLASSREKAQALIRAGLVIANDTRIDKPGTKIAVDSALRVKGGGCPYVSRGGFKLAGALDHFGIDPTDRVAIDVGSSTGGFTDVLLQRGASRVFAVDVGTNQLDYKIRTDLGSK